MPVSNELIKELRERTLCGIRDCKQALEQCDGDLEKAIDHLRKKGLAAAEKVSARTANSGRIFSYIHSNNTIGVLLELNCETDFVANTDEFQKLGQDICLQICAMGATFVDRASVPPEVVNRESEIYRDQVKDKPAPIQENIIKGKFDKFYKEFCLLEQSFIKDETITVEQLIKNKIGSIKEKISVKRFVRFQIAEK